MLLTKHKKYPEIWKGEADKTVLVRLHDPNLLGGVRHASPPPPLPQNFWISEVQNGHFHLRFKREIHAKTENCWLEENNLLIKQVGKFLGAELMQLGRVEGGKLDLWGDCSSSYAPKKGPECNTVRNTGYKVTAVPDDHNSPCNQQACRLVVMAAATMPPISLLLRWRVSLTVAFLALKRKTHEFSIPACSPGCG